MVYALASPPYKNLAEQPYNSLLYSHMAGAGLQVDEFYPHRSCWTNATRCSIFHRPNSLLNERNALTTLLKDHTPSCCISIGRAHWG